MADPKQSEIFTSQIDVESNENVSAEKKGTADDQRDMFRLGKAQELRVSSTNILLCNRRLTMPAKFPFRVHFRLLDDTDGQLGNRLGVSIRKMLAVSWESLILIFGRRTSIIGLINGGTAGMIWMFLVAWIGFLAVNTSMAEMGSM